MITMNISFLLLSSLLPAIYAIDVVMNDMVEWVLSEGGSFNDKLEMRKVDPTNPNSYMGVFAKEDIGAQESLIRIPKSCYIEIIDQAKVYHDENSEDEEAGYMYHENICTLSQKLMEEMKLGDKSKFAPYIAYLKTQNPGQLPVNWSEPGKNLLRKAFKPGSDVVDWIDRYYMKGISEASCINDDSFEIHMMEMTIQRSFDTALIPIWDMVNHHNGRINTENSSMYDKDGLKVRASRPIKSGEEIFASYDKCVDCKNMFVQWGTPEIFRDFGFVEGYPHRWIFDDEELNIDIWFEIKQNHKNELSIEWWFDEATGMHDVPNVKELLFLRKELNRITEVGKALNLTDVAYSGEIPIREWHMIAEYQKAAEQGVRLALRDAERVNPDWTSVL